MGWKGWQPSQATWDGKKGNKYMGRTVSFPTLVVVNSHKFISYTDWYLVILSHRIGSSLLNTIIPSYRQTTSAQGSLTLTLRVTKVLCYHPKTRAKLLYSV
jgi:hypothetical protein